MMIAVDLYNRMETDFRLSACSDDWREIGNVEFITEQYRKRYMGLVTDNTDTIEYVYTAVFPSERVVDKIISDGRRNTLLFVHHPMRWDITKIPVFSDIPSKQFGELRERQVAIYNLHVPLDANGVYGTTWNLAKSLDVNITDEFYEYHGVKVGIIGTVDCGTINELQRRFEGVIGHETALYPYGVSGIQNEKVALVAGGGNDAEIYPFLREQGINTYLTGIASVKTGHQPSIDAHNVAKGNKINILAGTHYSTEKFACIKMIEYFQKLGIPGEFVHDSPCMEDM